MSETLELDELDIVNAITHTDRIVFQSLRLLETSNRPAVIHQYLHNTSRLIGVLHERMRRPAITRMVVNVPLNMDVSGNFFDPVAVVPTAQQIQTAVEQVSSVPDTVCAICQEPITATASRIRHCRHCFHQDCISEWFTMNSRCPMCRHDIRESVLQPTRTPTSNESSRVHSDEE